MKDCTDPGAAQRILALDYGAKTVGVAVTDPLGWGAQGVETIFREKENHLRSTLRRITELSAEYRAEKIILGYPVNMDGTAGERAEKTEAFAGMVSEKTGLPVILVDERLTTVEAEEILEARGVPASERKKEIDRVAAAVILSDYLGDKERGRRVIKEKKNE